MAKQDIKAGAAYVELGLKDAAFTRGIAKAGRRLQSFGRGVATFGAGITAMGAAIVAPMFKAINIFAQTGDELDKMSNRTGATAQFLAEMGFAAEQAGQSLGTIEKGLVGSQKFVSDASRGLATAKDGLDALGVSLQDFEGLNAEQQFDLITSRLAGMEDATKRNEAAMLVFGKKMGPAIASISDGLAEARAEARELGLVPSDQEVKNAAEVTDAINRIRRVLSATFFAIGSALAPAVLPVLDTVKNILVAVQRWVKANGELFIIITKVGLAIAGAGTLITGLGVAIFGVGTILGGVASAIAFFGTVLGVVLSPLGLLTTALIGGVVAWARWTDSGRRAMAAIRGLLGPIGAIFQQTFGGIKDAIAGGDLQLAFQIAIEGIKLAFFKLVFSLQDQFRPFIETVLAGWDIILAVWDGATAAVKFAWDTLTSLLSDAWDNFADFFGLGAKDMGSTWGSFAEGLVAVFTAVSRTLIGIWESTVNTLANLLIDSGIFDEGSKELTRLKNAEIKRSAQRRVGQFQEDRDALANANVGETVTIGGEQKVVQEDEQGQRFYQGDEGRVTLGDLDSQLASAIESAAKDGVDPRDFQRQSVTDFTSGVVDAVEAANNKLLQGAAERSRKSTGDFTGVNADVIAEQQKRLDERTRQAEEARADAEAKREEQRKKAAEEVGGFDGEQQNAKVFGTFNAAAALAFNLGGKKPEDRVEGELKKLNDNFEDLHDIEGELLREMKGLRAEMVYV